MSDNDQIALSEGWHRDGEGNIVAEPAPEGTPFEMLQDADLDSIEIGEMDILFWRQVFNDGKAMGNVENLAQIIHQTTMTRDGQHTQLLAGELLKMLELANLPMGERIGILSSVINAVVMRTFSGEQEGGYRFDNRGHAALVGLVSYKLLESFRLQRESTTAAPDRAEDAVDWGEPGNA